MLYNASFSSTLTSEGIYIFLINHLNRGIKTRPPHRIYVYIVYIIVGFFFEGRQLIKFHNFPGMRFFRILPLIFLIIFSVCEKSPELTKESWADKPVNEWPDFSLTNEICFEDTTYFGLANSFLINTGTDTIGASCKHMFLVFRIHLNYHTISLGKDFNYWKLYPKNNPAKSVQINKLINTHHQEQIGQFNTLKNRDWIIFDLEGSVNDLYPLKIRYTPLKKGETIYAVGWGHKQQDNTFPQIAKFRFFRSLGNYYYAQALSKNINPQGRSGSPVIDKNGYLVGIISGAEGKLTVIGSIEYLKGLFDRYQVDYKMPDHE